MAAWEKMQREYPTETQQVPRIGEMGLINKFLNRGNYANTNPFGMININTDAVNKEGGDIDSILAHELKHVNQVKSMGPIMSLWKGLTNSQPLEDEAYKEEENRNKRMLGFRKDVNLPVEKK